METVSARALLMQQKLIFASNEKNSVFVNAFFEEVTTLYRGKFNILTISQYA